MRNKAIGDSGRHLVFMADADRHSRSGAGQLHIRGFQAAVAHLRLPTSRALRGNSLFILAGRFLAKLHLLRNLLHFQSAQIAIIHFGSDAHLFPTGYWRESIVYCFDCWPHQYRKWEGLFHRHAVRVAFFGARAAAEHFRSRVPGMKCLWLPEATDPSFYDPHRPLARRRIDVLEYGRRYQLYHDAITPHLERRGYRHFYQRSPGQIICDTLEDFVAALANAKVSVCFPSSMTSPERAGCETATHRYFESIASKCIVVGHCPAELADLFGYNPVLEVDIERASDQLEDVLVHAHRYQGFVDRNHERLLEIGTWERRLQEMLEALDTLGYRPKASAAQ
jgi:hypothetical protein